MKKQKIVVRVTEEVLGSPKEHVEKTLSEVIENLKKQKDIKILNIKIHEANQLENKMFSTFADIELETDSFKKLTDICFDFMPSTIEIIEPAGLEVDTNHITEMLNDLLAKMHKYSFVLNKIKTENIYLMKKIKGEIK